eukprot:gene9580-6735_t
MSGLHPPTRHVLLGISPPGTFDLSRRSFLLLLCLFLFDVAVPSHDTILVGGANAFTSPSDQVAIISQWRDKMSTTGNRVKNLRNKIQQHKDITEKSEKARKWVQDLEALGREQDAYEKQLEGVLMAGADREKSKQLKGSVFQKVSALKYSVIASTNKPEMRDQTRQLLADFKKFLEEARAAVKKEEQDLAEPGPEIALPKETLSQAERELLQVFLAAEETVQHCTDKNGCNVFLDALHQQQAAALSELSAIPVPAVTSDLGVLEVAEQCARMDQESRRRTFKVQNWKDVCDRMHLVLPSRSHVSLRVALEEAHDIKHFTNLVRHLIKHHKGIVREILDSYNVVAEGYTLGAELQRVVAEEVTDLEEKRELLHAKLAVQRKAYEEKMAQKQQEADLRDAEAERVEAKRRQKQMEELQVRLHLLAAYEARKAEQEEKEKELQRLKEEEEKADKAERMVINSKRVAFRQQVLHERQEEHQRREAELEELRRQKVAAMEKFFAAMNEKVGVEADFSRVLRATKSSEQTSSYVTFAEAGNVHLHGYTDDTIMRDPRARLYHALLEAGLHKCEYGRERISQGYRIPRAQQISDGNPFAGAFL